MNSKGCRSRVAYAPTTVKEVSPRSEHLYPNAVPGTREQARSVYVRR